MSASGVKCGNSPKVRKVVSSGHSKETARGKEHWDALYHFISLSLANHMRCV